MGVLSKLKPQAIMELPTVWPYNRFFTIMSIILWMVLFPNPAKGAIHDNQHQQLAIYYPCHLGATHAV